MKYLVSAILLFFHLFAFSSECSLYEKSHPNYPLTGAHLSTGKCTTCASCHKGGVFLGVPKTCIACHNGDPAWATVSRSAAHIPTGVIDCASCHTPTVFKPTAMNHTVVSSTPCKSCHSGSYTSQGVTGALGLPSNHVPLSQLLGGTALDCKVCHSSTASFLTETMNHNGSMGSGSGWCIGCHVTGVSYLGSAQKKSLTHQQKTPVPIDCSQSGCHRPLGNKGTAYRNWD